MCLPIVKIQQFLSGKMRIGLYAIIKTNGFSMRFGW